MKSETITAKCPVELRVYGNKGDVTGTNNGTIKEEIPNSIYDNDTKTVLIYMANDTYSYEVVGTSNGTYDLEIVHSENATDKRITIENVTTSTNSRDRYSVDWLNIFTDQEVMPYIPVANFTSNVTEGYAPLDIQFNDLSKNATHLEWNFGDGSSIVSDANPEHVFTSTGLFNVVLTTSNTNGTSSKSMTINVTSKPVLVYPVANFTANVTQGDVPLDVQFTDQSQNATHLEWNLGDASNNTSVANPEHVFNSTGLFKVVLTASNGNGSDSMSKTINVTSTPALQVFPGCTNLPTDLNNDGLYEDINGNGRIDFADVVTYFNSMQWIRDNGLTTYFDYNRNGRIDFSDVVMLFNMVGK